MVPHKKWGQIDRELKPVLSEIEKNGIKIDIVLLKKLSKKIETKSQKLKTEIQKMAGEDFNLDSPSQIGEILFKKLKLPTVDLKRTKTGISTSATELEKLKDEHEIIPKILAYRELTKLLTTYLRPLPLLVDKNDRIHTKFGFDTRTSRLTSSSPNLQNIPVKGDFGADIRSAFVAEKGNVLISADYSQIELRVVACLAQDTAMIEAFKNGEDIHARTAYELFRVPIKKVTHSQRRLAKTVNFGILYGMSPYGLSQALGIARESAAEYIFRYFDIHSGVKQYCQDQIQTAQKLGYVETLFGFRRQLPDINSNNRFLAESSQRMAVNTPVQGTAAEILKLAMIELQKKLSAVSLKSKDGKAKFLLTVHDELIVEAPKAEAKKIAKMMKDVMENEVKLCVPVEVEVGIGKNWDEAKDPKNKI